MAVTQNTLIGRSSGSIGGVTFSTWKGINVAKSKATSVADPKTPAQLAQRYKMTAALRMYKQASEAINYGFTLAATGMSQYNAFVSNILKGGGLPGNSNDVLVSAGNISFSSGTLDNTVISSTNADASANTATVNWPTTITGNQLTTDKAKVVILDNYGNVVGKNTVDIIRSAGTATVTTPDLNTVGMTFHAYLFFYQASTRKASDSQELSGFVAA